MSAHECAPQLRLWVPPPGKDETWLSFLTRSAQFYGFSRFGLVSRLHAPAATHGAEFDFDRWPNEPLAAAVGEALDIDLTAWNPPAFMDATVLPVGSRRAYCPRCVASDLAAGSVPFFRWAWALPMSVLCSVHRIPLRNWQNHPRAQPLRWPVGLLFERGSGNATSRWLASHLEDASAWEGALCARDVAIVDTLEALQAQFVAEAEGAAIAATSLPQVLLGSLISMLVAAPDSVADIERAHRQDARAAVVWLTGRRRHIKPFPRALRSFLTASDVDWRRNILWTVARLILLDEGSAAAHDPVADLHGLPLWDAAAAPAWNTRFPATARRTRSQLGRWHATTGRDAPHAGSVGRGP